MRVAATKALIFVLERTLEDAASGSNLRYTLDDLDARTGSSSSSSAGVGLFDDMADFSFTENLTSNERSLGPEFKEMETSLTEVE